MGISRLSDTHPAEPPSRVTSSMRSVIRAGLSASAGGILVNAANLGRDASIALAYGTSATVDAFFLAMMIPIFVLTVGTGAYRNAIVPIIQRIAHDSNKGSTEALLGKLMTANLPAVLGLGLLLAILAPLYATLMSGTHSSVTAHLIITFSLAVLPMFVLSGFANLAEGPLQIVGSFFGPSVLKAGLPIGIALGAIFLGEDYGVEGACFGGFIGAGAQLFLTFLLIRRKGGNANDSATIDRPLQIEIRKQFLLLSGGVSLAYISPIVDQWMAAYLDAGSVSTLAYANRLVLGLASLTIGALTPALLPHFSRLYSQGNSKSIRADYCTILRITVWGSIALAGVVWLLSEPLVMVFYERGSFTQTDTAAVATMISWLCLQFPPLFFGIPGATLLSAAGLNRAFIPLNIIAALTNISGNFLLMRLYGLAGIALSTVLTYIVSTTAINVLIHKKAIVAIPSRLILEIVISGGTAATIGAVLIMMNWKPGRIPTSAELCFSSLGLLIYCLVAIGANRPLLKAFRSRGPSMV